jgi:hypothetical protein
MAFAHPAPSGEMDATPTAGLFRSGAPRSLHPAADANGKSHCRRAPASMED